jgi:hypothetical protein
MKQNIGWTFLVCFFAILQVKIYLTVGVIAFIRKIYSANALRNLNQMIMNYFLPIYAIIEIARMTTKENVSLIWILIIGVVLSIVIGFICGRIAHYIFKLDERISYSFNLLTSLPSIGTLPLVLGKSLCYPGAPLEDDPECANILGFMLMNYLIFQLILNFVGFQVLTNDSNLSKKVDEKLSFLWRILIDKFVKKDYTVKYLFEKYMKDSKQAEAKFEEFVGKYSLVLDGMTYILLGEEVKNIDIEDIEKRESKSVNIENNVMEEKVDNAVDNADDMKNYFNNEASNPVSNYDMTFNDTSPKIHNLRSTGENKFISSLANPEQNNDSSRDIDDLYKFDHLNKEVKLTVEPKDEQKRLSNIQEEAIEENILSEKDNLKSSQERLQSEEVEFVEHKTEAGLKRAISQKDVIKKPHDPLMKELEDIIHDKKNKLIHYETDDNIGTFANNELVKLYDVEPIIHHLPLTADLNHIHRYESVIDEDYLFIHPDDFIINKQIKAQQLEEKQRVVNLRSKSSKKLFEHVDRYYTKVFEYIENDLKERKKEEYEHEKMDILKDLYLLPPKFPIVRCVQVNKINLAIVEEEWKKYEELIKKVLPNFKLTSPQTAFSMQIVLKFLFIPAIVGCIIGLFVGLSHMRDILFSTNHYITNLVDGIYILTRATVPIMYVPIGVGFVSTKGLTMQLPISKKYILISFIVRFVIIPGIGYIYVYLWYTYYGGAIATSKVLRITMFIPFCVPSTANLVVMTNIVRFFMEETAFILLIHNAFLIISLPTLYMIYFIIVGAM